MNREALKQKLRQIQDSAKRIRETAWEVENGLGTADFFGGDVFGTERRALTQMGQLEFEVTELAKLAEEAKASV